MVTALVDGVCSGMGHVWGGVDAFENSRGWNLVSPILTLNDTCDKWITVAEGATRSVRYVRGCRNASSQEKIKSLAQAALATGGAIALASGHRYGLRCFLTLRLTELGLSYFQNGWNRLKTHGALVLGTKLISVLSPSMETRLLARAAKIGSNADKAWLHYNKGKDPETLVRSFVTMVHCYRFSHKR